MMLETLHPDYFIVCIGEVAHGRIATQVVLPMARPLSWCVKRDLAPF